MPCVNPDGTLTSSGQAILQAASGPSTAAEVASKTGLQLFRVRSGFRELAAAGLVIEADGRFTVASPGTRTSATATNC